MTAVVLVEPAPVLPAAPPPLSGWWRRFAASVLDDALLGGVAWLALGPGVASPSLQPVLSVAPADGVPSPWTSPWVVGAVVVLVLLLAYTAATPGKRVAGVAVVRLDTGTPAGLLRSVARPVLHLLDTILLIGYLRPLWHPLRQTFADSALGTVVVVTRRPAPHPALARFRWRHPERGGSVALTTAAVVLCVLGVGLGSTTASTGGTEYRGAPRACEVVTNGSAAEGVAASVQETRSWNAERRLWVVRDVEDAGPGAEVTWTWQDAGDAEVVEVALRLLEPGRLRADGDPMTTVSGVGDAGGQLTAVLYPDDLAGVATGSRVESDLLLDGRPVATCRFDAPVG